MKKTLIAALIVGALSAGCATPTAGPTPTPTSLQVAVEPTATAPPTRTPVPPATPTITPANPACVRATAEVPEGVNPTHFMSSGPASGCYHSIAAFLGDVGLAWEQFVPGATITFWTQWPVDSDGAPIAPTPTPVPTYTLSGTVFFDYNGNGLREEGEPPIGGVPIRVAGLTTTSGPDGGYSLAGVPAGTQQVHVESPTQEPATAFRYINRFLGWVDIPAYEMNGVSVPAQHLADAEVKPIDQPLSILLTDDRPLDIALMQGFLTLPFRSEDASKIYEYHGFDHDPRVGFVLDYTGDTNLSRDPGERGTGDGHVGWDYGVPVGTLVLASHPGRLESWDSTTGNGTSINAGLRTGLPRMQSDHEPMSVYGHLSGLLFQQDTEVFRGQIIAASGQSGTMWPHLHFDLLYGPANPAEPDDYIVNGYQKDPFGVSPSIPVNSPLERHSCWTVFNDPHNPF